jgi:hypothetical protein
MATVQVTVARASIAGAAVVALVVRASSAEERFPEPCVLLSLEFQEARAATAAKEKAEPEECQHDRPEPAPHEFA